VSKTRINLMGNKKDFNKFCSSMDRVMDCRYRHCERKCWAWAVRDIQSWCDEGVTIDAAARKWATTGVTHIQGEEILSDLLNVDNLSIVRDILKEGKENEGN
jgi:hypothetical protein